MAYLDHFETEKTLTYSSSVIWNLESNRVARLTLTGDTVIQNPVTIIAGRTYRLILVQDSTGGHSVMFGYKFIFPNSNYIGISTGAGSVDIIDFYSDGNNLTAYSIKKGQVNEISNQGLTLSTRKYNPSHSRSCLRVRRDNDNSELDIGFSGFDLDESALTTFVGSNNGFVTKWYDQSGLLNDAVQTNTSYQPRIVNSGTVEKVNSKPGIFFDGVDDHLILTSVSLKTYMSMSITGKWDPTFYFFISSDSALSNHFYMYGNGTAAVFIKSSGVTKTINNTVWKKTTQQISSWVNNSSEFELIGDGLPGTSGPSSLADNSYSANMTIGIASNFTSLPSNGYFQEIAINEDATKEQTKIMDSYSNNYYKVF